MQFRQFATRLVATAAIFAAAPAARADVVSFTGWAVGPSTVQVTAPYAANLYAGEFAVNAGGVPLTTFCIDLMQSVAIGGTYNDYTRAALDPSVSSTQLGRFNRLYENYYDQSKASAASSAAFQAAVWEIISDGSGALNLGSGTFSMNSAYNGAVWNIASGWLADLDSKSSGDWSFERLGSATRQDQLIATHNTGQVPISGTLGLVAAAGLGLVAGNRRKSAAR